MPLSKIDSASLNTGVVGPTQLSATGTPNSSTYLRGDNTWTTGKLPVQIVTTQVGTLATGTTLVPFDNTIPQSTEGDQYMTLAITPTNVNSTLEIDVLWCGGNSGGNYLAVCLFQDSTANSLAASWNAGFQPNTPVSISLKHLMTAGTLSATTFKVRCGGISAGTTTFNGFSGNQLLGGVLASRITIKEYLP